MREIIENKKRKKEKEMNQMNDQNEIIIQQIPVNVPKPEGIAEVNDFFVVTVLR